MSVPSSVEPRNPENVPCIEEFKDGLKKLTAKKAFIEYMTQLAENAATDADVICRLIERKLLNSPKEAIVYTIYLIDSIIKTLHPYKTLFAPKIYGLFVHAYTTCSAMELREKLQAVFNSWRDPPPQFSMDIINRIDRFLTQASQVSDRERRKAYLTPDGLSYEAREWIRYTMHLDWKLSVLEADLELLSERELTLYKYFQRERNNVVIRINDLLDSITEDMRPKSIGEHIVPVIIQIPDEFKLHAAKYEQDLREIKIALDRLNQRQDEFVWDIRTHTESLKKDQAIKDAIRSKKMRFENFVAENEVVICFTPRTEYFPSSSKEADFADVIKNFGKRVVETEPVRMITNGETAGQVAKPVQNRDSVGPKGEKVIKIKKEVTSESFNPTPANDMLGLFGGSRSNLFNKTDIDSRNLNANDSPLFGYHGETTNRAAEERNDSLHSSRVDNNRFYEASNKSQESVDTSDIEVASVISSDGAHEDGISQEHDTKLDAVAVKSDPKEGSKLAPIKLENESEVDLDFPQSRVEKENEGTKTVLDSICAGDLNQPDIQQYDTRPNSNGQDGWRQDVEDDWHDPESVFNESAHNLQPLEDSIPVDKQEPNDNSEKVDEQIPSTEEGLNADNPRMAEQQLSRPYQGPAFNTGQLLSRAHNSSRTSTTNTAQIPDTESPENEGYSDIPLSKLKPTVSPHVSHEYSSQHDASSRIPFANYRPHIPPPRPSPPPSESQSGTAPESSPSDFKEPLIAFRPPTPPNTSHAQVKSKGSSIESEERTHHHNSLKRPRSSPGVEESSPKRLMSSFSHPLAASVSDIDTSLQDKVQLPFHEFPPPPLPPSPSPASPPAEDETSRETKEAHNADQDLKTELPEHARPEYTRKLSLSEFRQKMQHSDSHARPTALTTMSTIAQNSSSNKVAKITHTPTVLKSILRDPKRGETRATKRVRWDPALNE
ncbi:hypothetical protein CANMA_002037 [Candida margitis]|uniref:uncharacterized protein n=1 Tax=Candida margitis TaxID=1775924 RepID=UPI002227867F|nr:uncharacterized protein CANMA_002037 [Candida margitis]KAI5968863.1 hypothetical protein CANMA_002037 [Candida margitis]